MFGRFNFLAAALMAASGLGSGGDGPTGKSILVHKSDAEGALTVDAFSGVITTPPMERPEWSEGLGAALIAERNGFYHSRLGDNFTDELRFPEALNFDDLGWIGVDAEDGESEVEHAASDEFRQTYLAEALGIDTSAEGFDISTLGTTVETKLMGRLTTTAETEGPFPVRTSAEHSAFEEAKEQGFAEDRKSANG